REVAQTHGRRGFDLTATDRLQAAAEHFGRHGRIEERESDDGAREEIDGEAIRQEHGNSVAAMKSTARSGTARMPSTNAPEIHRTTGSRERRPSARHKPMGSAVANVMSVTTSVSSSPPQSVGTTTGSGPPPIRSRKNAAGKRMNPRSTRCRLAVCERCTTQVQKSAKAAKHVHARHNSLDG